MQFPDYITILVWLYIFLSNSRMKISSSISLCWNWPIFFYLIFIFVFTHIFLLDNGITVKTFTSIIPNMRLMDKDTTRINFMTLFVQKCFTLSCKKRKVRSKRKGIYHCKMRCFGTLKVHLYETMKIPRLLIQYSLTNLEEHLS